MPSLGNSNLSQAPLATSAPSNPTSYGHTGIPPSSSSSPSLSLLHHHHHLDRHPSKPLDAAELFSTSGHVVGLPNGALSHLLKPKHAFCLISFSSGSTFPFPCNLPFCNKKPCLQPSQYLNNNLGGHRGDIDEVGEQLNILSNPPHRHNVDRFILLLRHIITIITMRNLKAEYLVRSEC